MTITMAPTTFGDLVQLAGVSLLQGITSPLTWAGVALGALLPIACHYAYRDPS